MRKAIQIGVLIIFIFNIMFSCSGSNILTMDQVKSGNSVKIVFANGSQANGFIKSSSEKELVYISAKDHREHTVPVEDIRRIEKINKVFDAEANPISAAEIERVKSSRNTWGYALGGAALGGVVGLVAALPFWYGEVGNVPPYFVAGAGAVIGSIAFAYRGNEKDKNEAIEQIRYFRVKDKEMQEKVDQEKKELQKIEKDKEDIKKQLDDSKKSK